MFKENDDVLYIDEDGHSRKGVVTHIQLFEKTLYKVHARIDGIDGIITFSMDGLRYVDTPYPRITLCPKYIPLSFPRVMEVKAEHGKDWVKRVVIAIKNGYAVAWGRVSTIEDSESVFDTSIWKEYREVSDEIEEFTLEEVAKALGKDVNKIRIKK